MLEDAYGISDVLLIDLLLRWLQLGLREDSDLIVGRAFDLLLGSDPCHLFAALLDVGFYLREDPVLLRRELVLSAQLLQLLELFKSVATNDLV